MKNFKNFNEKEISDYLSKLDIKENITDGSIKKGNEIDVVFKDGTTKKVIAESNSDFNDDGLEYFYFIILDDINAIATKIDENWNSNY